MEPPSGPAAAATVATGSADPIGEAAAAAPRPIRRLDESVVNRVAAGEVIHRPASALKELLENSLDAGAASIAITVKDGGNKLLQVSDSGCGVRFEDLPILCERHTTSKLAAYEDLQSIGTFGFRGEALASISFVSHLTVTTMTAGAPHAWRATYQDGVMEGPPRPCAGVPGTTITVEDLFFNVPTRRKALKSAAEEYSKVLDVLGRYAALNAHVAVSCRKQGDVRADLHTPGSGSRMDAIRSVYGSPVASALLPVARDSEAFPSGVVARFRIEGFVTSANYASKKMTFVLFINSRLVDCAPLKRACDAVYSALLPKADKPFIFLSLVLPPEDVDVNVHPTKKEVTFLNQEEIVESVQRMLEEKLLAANSTRTFLTQTLLPCAGPAAASGPITPAVNAGTDDLRYNAADAPAEVKPATTQRDRAGGDHKLVRTDASNPQGRLDAFLRLRPGEPNGGGLKRPAEPSVNDEVAAAAPARRDPYALDTKANAAPTCNLRSVRVLLHDVDRCMHAGLAALCRQHTYVGLADVGLALVQHSTKLYLVNLEVVVRELTYQQMLRSFERAPRLVLAPPAPLRALLMAALDTEEAEGRWSEADGDKAEIADLTLRLLREKALMLSEYFSLDFVFDNDGKDGALRSLPVTIEQYTPDLGGLPQFLLALGTDVDWSSEVECFRGVTTALAELSAAGWAATSTPGASNLGKADDDREWTVQHVIVPSLRQLRPPDSLARESAVIEVADLTALYKVFERC